MVAGVLAGNRRSLTRLLTLVENNDPRARAALRALHPQTGKAHIVGITGPAGSGKSTLVHLLAREYRRRGKTVGIVAVDPSSPFTRGAILGDRVRMQDLTGDPGIFVRSMATRGAMGGLAEATVEMVHVLDAFGKDVVLIETVGTGQDEVDIVRTAQTVVVVSIPGSGDDIQALKAGILEIADLFVVNKADRDGADAVVADLRAMLHLQPPRDWKTPILKTIATRNEGITELVDTIDRHYQYLDESGQLMRGALERTRHQVLSIARQTLYERLLQAALPDRTLETLVEAVLQRELDPRSAADALVALVAKDVSETGVPSKPAAT
ncbi:MAG: methylmalonyl Co-A mutase-associated GTPase MeaB [Chloroflexi bacterium]|nr:methylmalonyl Co-A mutase-associated GTPase MeaB [Chloroflexota bacterium]